MVAFHYRGKTQQFGTKFAREQLQQYTAEINGALERDALCLCSSNDDEPLVSTNMDMTDKERALGYPERCHNHGFNFNCFRLNLFILV